jgi:hypothetical protein
LQCFSCIFLPSVNHFNQSINSLKKPTDNRSFFVFPAPSIMTVELTPHLPQPTSPSPQISDAPNDNELIDAVPTSNNISQPFAAAKSMDEMKPRDYQVTLFNLAKHQNILAVLDTGSGKTFIAVMLIKHLAMQERDLMRDRPVRFDRGFCDLCRRRLHSF